MFESCKSQGEMSLWSSLSVVLKVGGTTQDLGGLQSRCNSVSGISGFVAVTKAARCAQRGATVMSQKKTVFIGHSRLRYGKQGLSGAVPAFRSQWDHLAVILSSIMGWKPQGTVKQPAQKLSPVQESEHP